MLSAAKAWVGLLGAVVTALLGLSIIPAEGSWHNTLTIVAAICTAVLVYSVPNSPTKVTT